MPIPSSHHGQKEVLQNHKKPPITSLAHAIHPELPTSACLSHLIPVTPFLSLPHPSPVLHFTHMEFSAALRTYHGPSTSDLHTCSLLSPLPRMFARITPTCVSAFHLLQEAFLVLFSSFPFHPTWTSPGREQNSFPLLPCRHQACGTEVFYLYSLL